MTRKNSSNVLQLENLEPRMMLSTVQISAAGSEGFEEMQLLIDQTPVQTWTVGDGADQGNYQTYSFTTSQNLTADQIRIQFVSDVYDPAAGIDSNLAVDWIEVDGERFETESPSTYSTGTWRPEDGIAPGYREGEFLHGAGYFQYADAGQNTGTNVVVRARGDEGGERFNLLIDGSIAQTHTVTTSDQSFTYQHTGAVDPSDIRIEFINDTWDPDNGVDGNLIVDFIELDGERYETEAPTTYSTGSWLAADGTVPGLRQSETLNINGYFQFDGATAQQSSTYYVSTDGSDGHDDVQAQNRSTAWRSIQRAVEAAQAGDTIIVGDGAYTEEVFLNSSGESGNDIVIRAENQHGARVLGFFHGRDVSHITLEGFDVTNHRELLITESFVFYNSHHITIRNNVARDSYGGGINFNQSDWILIEGNIVHGNAFFNRDGHQGISIYQARDLSSDDREWGIIIRNNISYGNKNLKGGAAGSNPFDGNGIVLDDFANQQRGADQVAYGRRTLIENNLTYGNGGSGINIFLSHNVDVRNNTSVGNTTLLHFGGDLSLSSSKDIRVYNNVLSARPGQRALRNHASRDLEIYSNLIHGRTDSYTGTGILFNVPDFQANSYLLESGAQGFGWGSNLSHQPVDPEEFGADLVAASFQSHTVVNGNLESTNHLDGRSSLGAAGWEFSGTGGDWNPPNQFAAGEVEGKNVGYLNSGVASKNLGKRYDSSRTYIAEVDLGARFNQNDAGFEVTLWVGDSVIVTREGTLPGNGKMETVSLLLVDNARRTLTGQELRIEIRHVSGGQINFDNVKLYSAEIAEEVEGPDTTQQVELYEVSVGADGTAWAVGQNDSIWIRNGSSWTQVAGRLNQISVGSADHVWGVNSSNYIYERTGARWTRHAAAGVEGDPAQVSVGADGDVWLIDDLERIYRRNGTSWERISGALVQVSAGDADNVWGVNRHNWVYQRTGSRWTRIDTSSISSPVVQVEAASDGTVWAIAEDASIWRRTGNNWTRIAGSLSHISVGSATDVWGTNAWNWVYERGTTSWHRRAADLSID